MTHCTNTLTLWPILNELDLQPPSHRLIEAPLSVPLVVLIPTFLIPSSAIILLFYQFFPLQHFHPWTRTVFLKFLSQTHRSISLPPLLSTGPPGSVRVFFSPSLLPHWLSFTRASRRNSSIYRLVLEATTHIAP